MSKLLEESAMFHLIPVIFIHLYRLHEPQHLTVRPLTTVQHYRLVLVEFDVFVSNTESTDVDFVRLRGRV